MNWVRMSSRHYELFDGDKSKNYTVCIIGPEGKQTFEAWHKNKMLACNLETLEEALAVVKRKFTHEAAGHSLP